MNIHIPTNVFFISVSLNILLGFMLYNKSNSVYNETFMATERDVKFEKQSSITTKPGFHTSNLDIEEDNEKTAYSHNIEQNIDSSVELRKIIIEDETRRNIDSYIYANNLVQDINNLSIEEFSTVLANDFYDEIIDFEWARNKENYIFSLFTNDTSLADYSLNQVECRSSRCKLTLLVADNEQANTIVSHLSTAIKNANPGSEAPMLVADLDLENNSTNIFLMREHHMFFVND